MSITIDLPPNLERQLLVQAEQEGTPAETVAGRLLAEAIEWQARDFQEAAEGIRRGFEDGEAGRLKPADKVLTKLRSALELARNDL